MLTIPAILLTFAALFGYVNYRFLKLPMTIGLVIIALISSLGVILLDPLLPGLKLGETVRTAIDGIDFNRTLMEGMLSFLLFAGALHVDLRSFMSRRLTISLLATLGILLSTALNGLIFYFLTGLLGFNLPLWVCLVFGALISPTDPVAVMGVLKRLPVPPTLKAMIAGESLFNDGVAVVVYSILVTIAFNSTGHAVTPLEIAELFAVEALGGALLGLVAGGLAFLLMRGVDDYVLEIIITLALVTGAYALALEFHLSGPIAMVVAGILLGNYGIDYAMSDTTARNLETFWELVDEILNAVLFLLIGFEVIVLEVTMPVVLLSLAMIVATVLVRGLSISLPIMALSKVRRYNRGTIPIMTWAGLRGGISVALVLALPDFEGKGVLLTTCYAVVVFSIVAQGLTVERVIKRFIPDEHL